MFVGAPSGSPVPRHVRTVITRLCLPGWGDGAGENGQREAGEATPPASAWRYGWGRVRPGFRPACNRTDQWTGVLAGGAGSVGQRAPGGCMASSAGVRPRLFSCARGELVARRRTGSRLDVPPRSGQRPRRNDSPRRSAPHVHGDWTNGTRLGCLCGGPTPGFEGSTGVGPPRPYAATTVCDRRTTRGRRERQGRACGVL